MTIEDLKAIAQKALDHGIKCIRDDGELNQMFQLVGREKNEIVMCTPDVTNSEAAKAELVRDLKARVRSEGIEAVVMVSDSYIAENLTPAQEALRRAFRMTIEDCWKAGMIPKREAVSVTLESPIYQQVARQEYRRTDGGRAVELVGAPQIMSSVPDANGLSAKYFGRMMGFFPARARGACMTLTNGLLALAIIALSIDIWYTRKWLRTSKAQLDELQAFARRQLDGEP